MCIRDSYRDYYSEEYGESDELLFRQAIIDHFAANNTELLLLTNSKDSKYGYDVQLNTPDIPLGATKHPDRVGHRIIAHRIYETLNQMDKVPLYIVETTKRRPIHLRRVEHI